MFFFPKQTIVDTNYDTITISHKWRTRLDDID